MIKKITLLLLCTFIVSCIAAKEEKNVGNSLSNLPSWVINPNVEGKIAAVGISPKSNGGIKFQITRAENDARANIAAKINTEISRLTKEALKSSGTNGDAENTISVFTQATKAIVKKIPVRGAKRINLFRDDKDGTLYVQMILDESIVNDYMIQNKQLLKNSLKDVKNAEKSVENLYKELDKELN